MSKLPHKVYYHHLRRKLMSYMRLFIELRKEESSAPCGQVRVELQDQPGRVDCKVRCSLMGLPAGQLYEMVLLCERGGHYKEYPLGQFGVNPRGQAGPIFRGSFPEELGQIPVTEFKAVVARGSGSRRLVGFRFEPMLIPWRYEETSTAEVVGEAATTAEPEPTVKPVVEAMEEPAIEMAYTENESEIVYVKEETTPEMTEKKEVLPESEEIEDGVVLQEATAERGPTAFAPTAIFMLRELSQVDLVCGDAGRRAFQRYRHLILAQQGNENYLGIPCRFRPTHEAELAEEGYTLFYTPHGDVPSFGEFGYWMKRL